MISLRSALLFGWLLVPAVSGRLDDAPPRLLMIAATSRAPSSVDASCLVRKECAGAWSPGMRDRGVGEGIYLQFEDPTVLGAIVVQSTANVSLSVNGRPTNSRRAPEVGADGAQVFLLGDEDAHPSGEYRAVVKSAFIRISSSATRGSGGASSPSISAIRFYRPFSGHLPAPSASNGLVYPIVPSAIAAEVTASSVLEPAAAYQPSNLFDSRVEFAWSTDGKGTKGVGEWVKVRFGSPVRVAGVIVWSGYQRSATHFAANGRPSRLTASDSAGETRSVELKDVMGPQRSMFASPFAATREIRMTIDGIYRGSTYPDVLISELRFIDANGAVIAPMVDAQPPARSAASEPWLDRSFSSAICRGADGATTLEYSLKLRANGSFTSYRVTSGPGGRTETVWEGGWEEQGGGFRLFGMRYSSRMDSVQVAYGLPAKRSGAEIFEAHLTLREFDQLSQADKDRSVSLALLARKIDAAATSATTYQFGAVSGRPLAAAIVAKFAHSGAIAIESPLYSDLLVPTDSGACP